MKFIVFLFAISVICACSKEEPANALVGSWQLTSYCKPVSGSACTSITVPTDKHVLISFTNDGKFNETYTNTKPVEYSFLGCGGGSYQIEGNNLRIMAACMSSSYGTVMPVLSVRPDQLILRPFVTGEYVFVRID